MKYYSVVKGIKREHKTDEAAKKYAQENVSKDWSGQKQSISISSTPTSRTYEA
jgi:hypothetical protein